MNLRWAEIGPGKFEGKLILIWNNEKFYRLSQNQDPKFSYTSSYGYHVEPPDGMTTDLGSIPRSFWWLIPRDEFAPAFVIHDWLCYEDKLPRILIDLILRESIYTLVDAPSEIYKMWTIYLGVRVFAWWKVIRNKLFGR